MRDLEDIYELSPVQQGMLFHTLYAPQSGVYVNQFHCTLHGTLDVAAFQHAWQRVVDRHAALRVAFLWENLDKPLQVVRGRVDVPWEQHDWRGLSQDAQQEELAAYLKADRRRGFDLAQAPLLRLALFHVGADTYQFLWSHHHLLLDGWSVQLIHKEVWAFYEAFCQGQDADLDRPRPYRDYIIWLQQQDLAAAEAFWRKTLQGFRAPTPLRMDGLPGSLTAQEDSYATQRLHVSPATTAALQSLVRQYHLTMNTLIQGVWALLLSRYSGEDDVVFGATVSGRPPTLAGVESMVGTFINTLPVRVHAAGEQSLLAYLHALPARHAEVRQYEYSPLVEVQGWSEVPRGQPLFESIVVFENYPVDTSLQQPRGRLAMSDVRVLEQPNYPLTMFVVPGTELAFEMVYDCQRFEASTISRMLGHLQTLLEGIVADPTQRLSELPLLTEAERQQLLVAWNDTRAAYPEDACIHELFEAQVERTPNAVAVVCAEQRLSYRELNRRANQLAHHLQRLGVGPEVLVGICVERSVEMVVGLLGILKAGGAYVPLDPAYPKERLAFMLRDAQVGLVLTEERLHGRLPEGGAPVVCLDAAQGAIAQEQESAAAVPSGVKATNLAYVLYTSGSTGQPKGVMVTHRNVVNFLHAMRRELDLRAQDRLLAVTTLSFDIAGLELYLPLIVGACVDVASRELAADGAGLAARLASAGVGVLQATPATWRLLLEAGWPGSASLRLLCGGEALPRELARALLAKGAALWNLYGPTETTIWSAVARVSSQDVADAAGPSVPIGRPIANTQLYVLDRHRQPVPVGVPGELYIGGDGVARGYLRRPELTSERFLPDPFSAPPGARLYRTGDLVRYRGDGTLEYLGRLDHQVKVRGFRIELGEIEAVLAQHPAVQQAVVVVREDVPGDQRLVAYVVPNQGQTATVGELQRVLKEHLPAYMVPAAFVPLDALPLTPNGKLDRRALPPPDKTGPGPEGTFEAPRDELERQVAMLWERELRIAPIGITDNFFDLGGHSLLAVRIFSQIEKVLGKRLPLATLFTAPTIAQLAAILRQEDWSPAGLALVAIQPHGTRPPLFCIHAHGGHVLLYHELARRLGPDQPVYGLQAIGLDGQRAPYTRIEDMARHYVAELRSVQPHGPYFLAGDCLGGTLAYEVARQLHAQGDEVALLAMFDAFRPGHPKLRRGVPRAAFGAVHRLRLVAFHGRTLLRLGRQERWPYLAERVQRVRFALGARAGRLRGKSSPLLRTQAALEEAYAVYAPPPYAGQITLLRASSLPLGIETTPAMGWEGLAAGGVQVHELPYYWTTGLSGPNVAILAGELRACLERRIAAGRLAHGAAARRSA